MDETFTCKACGAVQKYNCGGRCKECGTGLLTGFSHANGECMSTKCHNERQHGYYLSDGNRFVYVCAEHKDKHVKYDWSKV